MATQAFIEVVAQTDGVEDQLQSDLDRIIEEVESQLESIRIEMEIDFDETVAALQDEIRRLEDEVDVLSDDLGNRFGEGFGDGANNSLVEVGSNLIRSGVEIGSSLASSLTQSVGSAFSSISSSAGAVAPVIATLASGFIVLAGAALAAGAALLVIPALFGGIGIAAAIQSDRVRNAFSGLKDRVISEIRGMVGPIEDVLVELTGVFRDTFDTIAPSLRKAFAAVAPIINTLGRAFARFAENLVPTLAGLVSAVEPLINVIGDGIAGLGTAIGGFFEGVATGAPGAEAAFKGLFDLINAALPFVGSLLGALSNIAGPIFGALSTALGTVLAAFQPIIPIFGELGLLISTSVAPIITTLGQAFASMAPAFIQLAQAFFTALQPVLVQLPTLINPILMIITEVASIFGQLASEIVVALAPSFATMGKAFGELFAAAVPVIVQLSGALLPLIRQMVPAIIPVIQFVGRLATALSGQLANFITSVVVPAIKALSALLRGDFSGALNFGKQSVSGFANIIKNAFQALVSRMRVDSSRIVEILRNVPNRARAALGNLSNLLRPAGQALIRGFVQGMLASIGAVRSAASSIAGAARNFFPFSPAKEGPFSGKGYTTYSGEALMQGFIGGIKSQQDSLTRQLSESLGAAQMAVSPSGGMSTPARTLSQGLSMPGVATGSPSVTVMIGNRIIDDHIRVQINDNNQMRDRTAAQGLRR